MATKHGLARGLDALLPETDLPAGVTEIAVSQLDPNPDQPRRTFDTQALEALAESIRQAGVLQPLLVVENGARYRIVAGERRYRAARMAGLQSVPCVVRDMTEQERMEAALIENLQREDLNAIEEASGYKLLMERYGMTQEQVAKRVGKSRPAVANALRLLNLPPRVMEMVEEGEVSPGHARALLSFEDPEQMMDVAQKVRKGKYSVRDIEKMSKHQGEPAVEELTSAEAEDVWGSQAAFFTEMELALSGELGRKVKIARNGNSGILQIQFYNEDDLKELAQRLTK